MSAFDHSTGHLSIDLGALVGNWQSLQQRVGPSVICSAVVKADAYGLGMKRVAPALAAAGCGVFFVATLDEGMALRRLCRKADIYVLCGPLPGTAADYVHHRLFPVLNDVNQVGLWAGYAHATGQSLDAALHVDTGMSRLGLDAAYLLDLAAHPDRLNGIRLRLLMSHMACADEPQHEKNPQQLALFSRLAQHFSGGALHTLGASSTIFLGKDYHFHMVRPGAALYGLNPVPGQPNPMQPVVQLGVKILQIRDVDSPQTVGYGATHVVKNPGRLAIVAAGYADGLHRSLGNRGFGTIEGFRVPVVGRVSMDLTIFDVSAVPAQLAYPGASITLIGPEHTADDLAVEAGTIGYEILTSLGRRYRRIYRDGTV